MVGNLKYKEIGTKTIKIIKKEKKGQILSTDFIVSVIIFFMILSMFFFLYDYTQDKNDVEIAQYRMYRESKAIGNMIVNLEGYPPNWNPSTVKSIGCGNLDNILNLTKLHYLEQILYYKLKELFALVGNDNFFINISFVNGTQYLSLGKYYGEGSVVISSLRYGVINMENKKEVVSIKVIVWV